MTGTHQGYKFLSRSARTNLPWHRPVEGEIKTVTIKRDVNHWYVCFSVERDSVALPESSEDIGMDVGLDSFVALSNGLEIDNPRHLKRGLAHLRRAQRRLSRRKRGSHRRRKAATLVAKAHRKIRNQRAAFHHDLSRWLVERYGLIAVEDLNIKGLSRGILAGPVHDAGWNSFFAKLRSEEHTSELQSRLHLVCRLLLEKKKKKITLTATFNS